MQKDLALVIKMKCADEPERVEICKANKELAKGGDGDSFYLDIYARKGDSSLIRFQSTDVAWCKSEAGRYCKLDDSLNAYRKKKEEWIRGLVCSTIKNDLSILLALEKSVLTNFLSNIRQYTKKLTHEYASAYTAPLLIEEDLFFECITNLFETDIKNKTFDDAYWAECLDQVAARSTDLRYLLLGISYNIANSGLNSIKWRHIKMLVDIESVISPNYSSKDAGIRLFVEETSLPEKVGVLFPRKDPWVVILFVNLSHIANEGRKVINREVLEALDISNLNFLLSSNMLWRFLSEALAPISLNKTLSMIRKESPKIRQEIITSAVDICASGIFSSDVAMAIRQIQSRLGDDTIFDVGNLSGNFKTGFTDTRALEALQWTKRRVSNMRTPPPQNVSGRRRRRGRNRITEANKQELIQRMSNAFDTFQGNKDSLLDIKKSFNDLIDSQILNSQVDEHQGQIVNNLVNENEFLKRHVEKLNEHAKTLQNENKALRKLSSDIQNLNTNSFENILIEDLKMYAVTLKEENALLRRFVQIQEESDKSVLSKERNEELAEANALLSRQVKDLTKEMERLSKDKEEPSSWESEREAVLKTNQDLREENEKLDLLLQKSRSVSKRLAGRCDSLKLKSETLHDANKKGKKVQSELTEKHTQLTEENALLSRKVKDLTKEMERLSKDKEEPSSWESEREAVLKTNQDLREENERLNLLLQKSQSDGKRLAKKYDAVKSTTQALHDTNMSTQKDLEQLSSKYTQLAKENKSLAKDSALECRRLEEECNVLRKEVQELVDQLNNSRTRKDKSIWRKYAHMFSNR